MNTNCFYYQTHVVVEKTWFIVGIFRNEDHVAFERTLDGRNDILEFFVPVDQEADFLELIRMLEVRGYVFDCQKMDNRLAKLPEPAPIKN